MIKDINILQEIIAEWTAVEELFLTARYSWTEVEAAPSIIEPTRDVAIVASNLCVIFATAILEKALAQFREEKVFKSNTFSLNNLMEASTKNLSWRNYRLIDDVRRKRNAIAHENVRFSEEDCFDMILAIREELVGWSILEPTKDRRLLISRG